MKVNDTATRGTGVSTTGKAAEIEQISRSSSGGAQGAGAAASDRVELSKLSEQVQAADENSPERHARLEQLRQAVDSGSYRVDEQAVSKAIIEDALRGDGKA